MENEHGELSLTGGKLVSITAPATITQRSKKPIVLGSMAKWFRKTPVRYRLPPLKFFYGLATTSLAAGGRGRLGLETQRVEVSDL
jgi:hypothetical protein